MITGIVDAVKTNDWGFTSYKVSSTWYGGDKKGAPSVVQGDMVTFEAFEKPGKDGRTFPTIKLATLKKLPAGVAQVSGAGAGTSGASNTSGSRSATVSRDSYWADKEANDKNKEPRIAYFAALERAQGFVDLALRNGAISAYAKAKDSGKLEILTALVYETTQRIMAEAYTQEVPKPGTKQPQVAEATAKPEQAELESDPEESWA